jgi:hypothetical protein
MMWMELDRIRREELIQERERDELADLVRAEPGWFRLALARRLHALAASLETPGMAYTRPRSLSSR